ncbi:MAG: hypothetical protein IJX77_06275 [Ruminococcus sp.]|nr:hypothetical protein [Ruminococcus sp.]
MAVYDNRQMKHMRQDAIRRSQEMHNRSVSDNQNCFQGHHKTAGDHAFRREQNDNTVSSDTVQPRHPPHAGVRKGNQMPDLLEKLSGGKILDSEKLLIIALMILLAKEGADMKLILALGYILL